MRSARYSASGCGRERQRQALRQHHLHHVAVVDVTLGALHRRLEAGFAERRLRLLACLRRLRRNLRRRAQRGEQFAQPRARLLIRTRDFGFGVHHQRQFSRKVVDDGDLLGQHQQYVGRAQRIRRRGMRKARLDIAHRVVAEAADQPAAETRQAGQGRHLEALEISVDERQRIARVGALGDAVARQYQDGPAAHVDARGRGEPDEGIAAEALAALHRFEQIGIGLVGQLEIDRQRRIEIGEGLEHHGDAVETLRGEALEFDFSHDCSKNDPGKRLRVGAILHAPREQA